MKLVVAFVIIGWLLLHGPVPRPWTAPGYGKRRQTEWMRKWRRDAGLEQSDNSRKDPT